MTKWTDIFEGIQRFDRPESEPRLWQEEIIFAIPAFKGMEVAKINEQICKTLRGIISKDGDPPRANSNRTNTRYNVADVIMWVKLWRKNSGMDAKPFKSAASTKPKVGYARTVCNAIQERIDAGERVKAALLVDNPCGETEVCNALGVNRGPTNKEITDIRSFCRSINFMYDEVLKSGKSRGSIDTTGIGSNGRGSFEQQTEM